MAPWPPLITDAARPAWMVWRDGLLTLLLWVALLWLFVRQSVVLGRRIDEILLSADPASPAA